ncbi:MAG: hypothetical protein U0805_06410 [Pirellulales bacterium]
MKTRVETTARLVAEGRWDIDYHMPPTLIKEFPDGIVKRVSEFAVVSKTKRDPTKRPDEKFQYIDIASVDVVTGTIANPQEITGAEAPSRARKVVRAFDIIISTCRPTRGAIAVVPEELHGEICSTGFSVIRTKPGVNPFYLHFALRLASTLEQFRKWSTGSSYPAILDDDVLKTQIPCPDATGQDNLARTLRSALKSRATAVARANAEWESAFDGIVNAVKSNNVNPTSNSQPTLEEVYSIEQVQERLKSLLPPTENGDSSDELNGSLFDVLDEPAEEWDSF